VYVAHSVAVNIQQGEGGSLVCPSPQSGRQETMLRRSDNVEKDARLADTKFLVIDKQLKMA
jgi:hypothetical protein